MLEWSDAAGRVVTWGRYRTRVWVGELIYAPKHASSPQVGPGNPVFLVISPSSVQPATARLVSKFRKPESRTLRIVSARDLRNSEDPFVALRCDLSLMGGCGGGPGERDG